MDEPERQYEIVLLGATGYTGKYIVEYIVKQLPTNLKWAVAGRSAAKLNAVIEEGKQYNSDRHLPYVEVCTLDPTQLETLAKKTTVLVNAIGPYHIYSEPVVKACAENGTHYIDCTGEIPWVKKMITNYEATAKESGAIMIPQAGFESSPSDLLALSLVNYIRNTFHAPTRDLVNTVYDFSSAAISGGSLATVFSIFDGFSLSEIASSEKPWSISPEIGKLPDSRSLSTFLTGIRNVPGLGLVATSITATSNAPIVQRSASLAGYGKQFRYEEYFKPASWLRGAAAHWALNIGGIFLLIPPFRWVLSKFITPPGQGPDKASVKDDFFELRGVAEADTPERQKVRGRMRWQGSAYDWTGAFLAVGAGLLARGGKEGGRLDKEGGVEAGFATPALLGDRFIREMEKAGMVADVEELKD